MANDNQPERQDRLISRAEAGRRLGVSVDTIKRMAQDGTLNEVRLRNQVRLRESEIDAIVAGEISSD